MKNTLLLFLLVILSSNIAHAEQLQNKQTSSHNSKYAEQTKQRQTPKYANVKPAKQGKDRWQMPSYNVYLAEQMQQRQKSKKETQSTTENNNICDDANIASNKNVDKKLCKDVGSEKKDLCKDTDKSTRRNMDKKPCKKTGLEKNIYCNEKDASTNNNSSDNTNIDEASKNSADKKPCIPAVINLPPIDLKVESMRNNFPKVPFDKNNYDKEKYQKKFDKYCNRFIKHYQNDLIANTPKTSTYSDEELKNVKLNSVGMAKKKQRDNIDDFKISMTYYRGESLSWIYLFHELRSDIDNHFKSDVNRKVGTMSYAMKKTAERIQLMDKKYYNPEKCSIEPLFLEEEQITKFLNNEKPYFGDLTSKETDRLLTCLEFFDFEQRCLSCHYDLVEKDSFITRDYSDGEMCLFNILDDYQDGLAKGAQEDFSKLKVDVYEIYEHKREAFMQ